MMVKHFCNMCCVEVKNESRVSVRADCEQLHIVRENLDFCPECAKKVFGQELIGNAQVAFEARVKRAEERRKARAALSD